MKSLLTEAKGRELEVEEEEENQMTLGSFASDNKSEAVATMARMLGGGAGLKVVVLVLLVESQDMLGRGSSRRDLLKKVSNFAWLASLLFSKSSCSYCTINTVILRLVIPAHSTLGSISSV